MIIKPRQWLKILTVVWLKKNISKYPPSKKVALNCTHWALY